MTLSSVAAYTIGTAGHVDHGKSTLINALTGIDPDRLREEKERGMTIDLGFAWLQLPSGREVSIVDVPGHERFVHNMLAGVGGIDAALVVIAADEGVMPQTREHVAILDLLGISRAVVALTKCDLVDEEWRELVREDIAETLAGTVVGTAPVVEVSATQGQGLAALVAQLEQLLADTPPKRDLGHPRLPVDRVFTLGGFGTVVTGTLLDGAIDLGQELEIQPGGLRTRARGLQSHQSKVDRADPGRRVAINLAGLAVDDLERGAVVASPGWLRPTQRLDARLQLVADAPRPLKGGTTVALHIGTAEVVGKVRLLDAPVLEPGAQGWVQVSLQVPVAVLKGDLFIIRQLSPAVTWGGGEIVDVRPTQRHRRGRPEVLTALEILATGDPEEIVLQTLALGEPLTPPALDRASGLATSVAQEALTRLQQSGQVTPLGALLMTADGWERVREQLLSTVQDYHRQYPLRRGMPREELRSRRRLRPRQFAASLDRLMAAGELVEGGALVRTAHHTVRLSAADEATAAELLRRLAAAPRSPPSLTELRGTLTGLSDDLLDALVAQERVVRVSQDVCFTPAAFDDMTAMVVAHLREHGSITVAAARDLFGTSRRYVLALLEQLDHRRVTRRVGDERVLLQRTEG